MYRVSIEGFSFHGLLEEKRMDIFHMLESVRFRYRADAVGIWNGFFTSTEDDYIRQVGQALRERELALPNLAVDGASVWYDDPADRERSHEAGLRYLRIAAMLGAKSLRIDWGVTREELTGREREYLVRRYREYAGIARENGFVVCAENHFGAARVPELMESVLEEIDHPAYKIMLHVGNWTRDPEAADERFTPHAVHTHVMQSVVEQRLPQVLEMFRRRGYRGYVGVEHHSGKNEYSMVDWQVAAVRRGIAELAGED